MKMIEFISLGSYEMFFHLLVPDPLMKIRYDRVILGFDDNFEPIVNTNITCSVWATAGKPHESIWINMTCGEDILSEMTYFENSGFYFEGALQQRYNSSMVEHCLCIVNDLHGTYGITKLISSQGWWLGWLLCL